MESGRKRSTQNSSTSGIPTTVCSSMESSANNGHSESAMNGGSDCSGRKQVNMAEEGPHPAERLKALATEHHIELTDPRLARILDERDELKHFRELFHIPTVGELLDGEVVKGMDPDQSCSYFSSNSLGLMPKSARGMMEEELDKWATKGVRGHLEGKRPWAYVEELTRDQMARMVGATREEVVLMNALTVNLHLGLISFYRPSTERYKIMCEKRAFPSDHYAFESHLRLHGYDPAEALICIEPREGEQTWRMEDILNSIEKEGDTVALVIFSGVHYFTGQCYNMAAITEAAHRKGCQVGFDLAHAVGNVELCLHDWDVDFACWCTYKYLSGGCGSPGGFFVHERHARSFDIPRLVGWWAHKMDTRFVMDNKLDLIPGAGGFQVSNPSPFAAVGCVASLEVFDKATMPAIRAKSLLLTGYLELLLDSFFGAENGCNGDGEPSAKLRKKSDVTVDIVTPRDVTQRGCQLSLSFSKPVTEVHSELKKLGIVVDVRGEEVMRVAPSPLVNSFMDVHTLVQLMCQAFNKLS